MDIQQFRLEFLRLLTEDSGKGKKRNQAIFDAERGYAIFYDTDLDMVMDKFDKAVLSLGRESYSLVDLRATQGKS